MSNFGRLRERRKKFNLFSGRTLAVLVITAVAAVSFSLGYNVGRSGVGDQAASDAVQVVPEGAGLVLLDGGKICEDTAGGSARKSSSVGKNPSGAILETMKAPSVPKPDSTSGNAGPDEPVLEPVRERKAAVMPQRVPEEPGDDERRVAPIRQLPRQQEEDSSGSPQNNEILRDTSVRTVPEKVTAPSKSPERDRAPATRRVPEAKKKPTVEKMAAESSEGRTYSVQVGAFRSLSDAQTHRLRFSKKGYKASVYKDRDAGGSDIFKVRIGVFTARGDAEKMALRLKSAEGVNAFVSAIK